MGQAHLFVDIFMPKVLLGFVVSEEFFSAGTVQLVFHPLSC